jgi:hypothetical protein
MTLSTATFSSLGSSVSDIFAGIGAQKQGALQAEGLDIQAQGTQISSQSTQITAQGLRTQAAGNIAEATEYNEAAGPAEENEAFTAQSTRIQEAQQQRQETQTIGSQKAAVGGAGFSEGGSPRGEGSAISQGRLVMTQHAPKPAPRERAVADQGYRVPPRLTNLSEAIRPASASAFRNAALSDPD